jgi:hypothetical protein
MHCSVVDKAENEQWWGQPSWVELIIFVVFRTCHCWWKSFLCLIKPNKILLSPHKNSGRNPFHRRGRRAEFTHYSNRHQNICQLRDCEGLIPTPLPRETFFRLPPPPQPTTLRLLWLSKQIFCILIPFLLMKKTSNESSAHRSINNYFGLCAAKCRKFCSPPTATRSINDFSCESFFAEEKSF